VYPLNKLRGITAPRAPIYLIAVPVLELIGLLFTLISLGLFAIHPVLASPTIGIASLFT